ncbi:MAG: arsenic transporter [Acidobacteriota bacterium]|nr:arsenic transporter [Acidobacteriota bacterium]
MMEFLSAVHLHTAAIWLISLVSIALVLIRPKGLPEAWWATVGACLLVLCRLMSSRSAAHAIGKGVDVYLFLIGMMIMSELARRQGVFNWVAGHAVRASKGSRTRLFLLIYGVGTVVTVFLSNDATAVVLTPAVLAAVREAEAEPLPYLLVCAFIANAASFVLPISNPANLVVYSGGMPPLGRWLLTFGLPSLASILMTFVVLRGLANKLLQGQVKTEVDIQPLSPTGKLIIYGIGFLAITLMTASALNVDLGAPACAAGLLVAAGVSVRDHATPKDVAKEVSWSVIPLVAGLFVIVEAMNGAGALSAAIRALEEMKTWQPLRAALSSGFGIAFISNLMNNLPSGLISGAAVKAAAATGPLRNAVLIGVDLGPNLSVTGSLATILWLVAIRREGQEVGFWKFLKWGALVMPPALALAILAVLLSPET